MNTWNKDTLTLHIRITKKCNADCSYCSSYEEADIHNGSLEEYQKAMSFISQMLDKYNIGGKRRAITVQYVGGEVLTVPMSYLESITEIIKNNLEPHFEVFRHGVQSNLIGSKDKVIKLVSMFGSNIGTSIDSFTDQRTINGDHQKYKTIFIENHRNIKKYSGYKVPGIVVINENSFEYIGKECELANKNLTNITLRPVFEGGLAKTHIEEEKLLSLYTNLFEDWFMNYKISIEPFTSLLVKRIANVTNDYQTLIGFSGCPFQHNCGKSSLNLEPNGDLYVCLDMADTKQYKIGNAFNEEINEEVLNKLQSRTEMLNNGCLSCNYFNECQGGCMSESINHTGDIYGKTAYCFVWKHIFRMIDQKINDFSIDEIQDWIKGFI